MQNYPVKFDAMYGFECARDFSNVQALREPIATCVEGTSAGQRGYTTKDVLNSMDLHYNYVGLDDDSTTRPPTRGLSQFLRDTGVQEDDFVVVKMDVEGIEYDLLERLMADGSHKLIDEVRGKTAPCKCARTMSPPPPFPCLIVFIYMRLFPSGVRGDPLPPSRDGRFLLVWLRALSQRRPGFADQGTRHGHVHPSLALKEHTTQSRICG